MPNIRRGVAPGASGDDVASAARASAGIIESSSGKAMAMPAPRRNRRRDSAGRKEMCGAAGGADRLVFTRVGERLAVVYLFWNRSLCTNSWMRSRTP